MRKAVFLLLGVLMLGALAVVVLSDSQGNFSEISDIATSAVILTEEPDAAEEPMGSKTASRRINSAIF